MFGRVLHHTARFKDSFGSIRVTAKLSLSVIGSSKGGHLATQRMPLPLLFKGYCSKLSIKLKIQDGARRVLGGLKGCRCIFSVIYKYVKEILYMWIKVMA